MIAKTWDSEKKHWLSDLNKYNENVFENYNVYNVTDASEDLY